MAKPASNIPKKRGRPKTTVSTGIMLRLQPSLLTSLDRWINKRRQPKPSRPEAVRLLLADALLGHSRQGRDDEGIEEAGVAARGKAEMAIDDVLADVDAPHEEKAQRKKKLTRVAKELRAK